MIAIIADIHGNYPALKAVLKEIDIIGCKRIISLGDVAGYYCMVNECIDVLRARGIVNLMGNHDSYLIENKYCPRSKSANTCLDYQRKIIAPENLAWLSKSKRQLRLSEISMVHGGWNDTIDEYLYSLNKDYFARLDGSLFLSGHTHVQIKNVFEEKIYCNPGSIGQPRDGDPRAAFALIDGSDIQLKRVEYDVDIIAQAMQEASFEEKIYQNLFRGTQIGGKISSIRIE